MYNCVYKISNEPYLQPFQYKILNKTVTFRYNLYNGIRFPVIIVFTVPMLIGKNITSTSLCQLNSGEINIFFTTQSL